MSLYWDDVKHAPLTLLLPFHWQTDWRVVWWLITLVCDLGDTFQLNLGRNPFLNNSTVNLKPTSICISMSSNVYHGSSDITNIIRDFGKHALVCHFAGRYIVFNEAWFFRWRSLTLNGLINLLSRYLYVLANSPNSACT